MNILVTGGAGYIGSHTCLELLRRGHQVIVADNLVNAQAEAVERVKELAGSDFPFYPIDIRDEAALEGIFDQHSIDCVIISPGSRQSENLSASRCAIMTTI